MGTGIACNPFIDWIVKTIHLIGSTVSDYILWCLEDFHLIQQLRLLQMCAYIVPNINCQILCSTWLQEKKKR